MVGWDVDAIIIDSPNRQGGFFIRSALAESNRVTYTTTPDEDGRTGVMWARYNVAKFRELSLLNPDLHEAGIIVTRWPDTIPTLLARGALEALDEDSPGPVLRPLITPAPAASHARTCPHRHARSAQRRRKSTPTTRTGGQGSPRL